MNFAFLLLGSNLNDRSALLLRAKEEISMLTGEILQESSVYESEPWGFQSDKRFLNQVVKIETELAPAEVLVKILQIESKLGRQRTGEKGYESRLIDIDILFYNDEIIRKNSLTIPHPKIPERMFTLLPLNELAPSLIHPESGKSVSELLKACPDTLHVYLYKPK